MIQSYKQLIKKSVTIRNKFYGELLSVKRNFPELDEKRDARITFYSKMNLAFDASNLTFIFCDYHLIKNGWWTNVPKKYALLSPSPDAREMIRCNFNGYTATAAFHLIFSSFESTIRSIVRHLDRAKYSQISGRFDQIYGYVLDATQLKKRYSKFMNLLTTIRNTIHNNGVYSPTYKKNKRTGKLIQKNKQISWKQFKFKFRVGRIVKFYDFWNFIFSIARTLLKLMKEIINSSKISQIKKINDLSKL